MRIADQLITALFGLMTPLPGLDPGHGILTDLLASSPRLHLGWRIHKPPGVVESSADRTVWEPSQVSRTDIVKRLKGNRSYIVWSVHHSARNQGQTTLPAVMFSVLSDSTVRPSSRSIYHILSSFPRCWRQGPALPRNVHPLTARHEPFLRPATPCLQTR